MRHRLTYNLAVLLTIGVAVAACSSNSTSPGGSPGTPSGKTACSDRTAGDAGPYLTDCPTCEKYCKCAIAVEAQAGNPEHQFRACLPTIAPLIHKSPNSSVNWSYKLSNRPAVAFPWLACSRVEVHRTIKESVDVALVLSNRLTGSSLARYRSSNAPPLGANATICVRQVYDLGQHSARICRFPCGRLESQSPSKCPSMGC